MSGVLDQTIGCRLNRTDLVVPDGQPVRWALNFLHTCRLPDRCYGPTLLLNACARAADERLPVYFYGSRTAVVKTLVANLQRRVPNLQVAGFQPSLFRRTTMAEKQLIAQAIISSGARLVMVGLGCPRQETWVYEYRDTLSMPLLAVGAAFDFHAGLTSQAPKWIQDRGLEWLFRLRTEPRRLWRRYILLNPLYIALVALQAMRLRSFKPRDLCVSTKLEMFG
jgi:exopolysaccharide biosynthesis WecB/TagA/CpsF family protein